MSYRSSDRKWKEEQVVRLLLMLFQSFLWTDSASAMAAHRLNNENMWIQSLVVLRKNAHALVSFSLSSCSESSLNTHRSRGKWVPAGKLLGSLVSRYCTYERQDQCVEMLSCQMILHFLVHAWNLLALKYWGPVLWSHYPLGHQTKESNGISRFLCLFDWHFCLWV